MIYQIYPRSFQDSDGDGVGDLRGITKRVGYLKELGVTAVWLSPTYPSPMQDFGYDVSDFTAVDRRFGSMADLEQLITTLHGHGLKLLLDFVANHTSDQHPWFVAARASKTNPKRDWYIWHDPAPDGGPPNNWRSVFAGSAWTLDPATGQYYYHAFLPEQPDLNWRNPQVREAMRQVLRFWLDKGVDGFRVDAIGQLVEDAQFRDEARASPITAATTDYDHLVHDYTTNLPETHAYLHEIRKTTDSYPGDRVLVSEAYLPIPQLMTYYGTPIRPESQLPFNFYLIGAPWQPRTIAAYVQDYEAALPSGAWPNWVLGNHDRSRVASRLGPDQERIAAMLLLTLRGTPTLYYGDELGLHDALITPAMVQDPAEKREPGKGIGRDPERSPMPWSGGPQAGFTTGQPWLPLSPDAAQHAVSAESRSPSSLLTLYKKLLLLRRESPALTLGTYETIKVTDDLYVYSRHWQGQHLVVALNFSGTPQSLSFLPRGARVRLSSAPAGTAVKHRHVDQLSPHAGLILELPAVTDKDASKRKQP